MWIKKKKWKAMEKKIADLEVQVQSQQKAIKYHLECHESEFAEFEEAIAVVRAAYIGCLKGESGETGDPSSGETPAEWRQCLYESMKEQDSSNPKENLKAFDLVEFCTSME